MKKTNFMRIASVLMVLTLLSTCAISGTFAKYVTADTSSDNARVAKWGVTVTSTDESMFKNTYAATDSLGYTGNAVVGAGTDLVFAPGTSGALTGVEIKGTPEVAVRVTNAAELTLTNFGSYCPIIFTVGTTEYYIGKDATITDTASLEEAVEKAIAAYTKDYAPGTVLDSETEAVPVVSWEWEFEQATVPSQTDADDTTLAASGATIKLEITTTVTQID